MVIHGAKLHWYGAGAAGRASYLPTIRAASKNVIDTMANYTQREWRMSQSTPKTRTDLGQTAALGGTTLALFAYIVYHFIYPLIAKGLLF